MGEDLCGHIIRTEHYVWCCFLPRADHPTQPNKARDNGLSHRMQVRHGPELGVPE